jgi:Domain of unknown function (DUF4338)/Transposase DNA-binding/Transposase Tn5 dimerisation domain
MVVCGQNFSSEMISRIQTKVNAEPGLSRGELSRQVCQWMDWRTRRGDWQEGSCRKALAVLQRRQVVTLPERKRICQGKPRAKPVVAEVKLESVSGGVQGLGEVTVKPIPSRHCRDSKIARALLERYHPLGAGTLRGAQMRYLVSSSRFGYLGVLTFSSGTWALQERDEEIGWSEEARRAHLPLLVRNDRFLILPTVRVRNLASHVLALTVKRLAEDWEQRYAVRPVLVETFVDPKQYKGTCYRAANWREAGKTAGRRDGIAKTIFIYPLQRQWRKQLCTEPPPPRLGEAIGVESPRSWAEEEFGRVRFHDARLKERLYQIAKDFAGCSKGPIPERCGTKARTMGAYRFLQNPKVSMDVLLTAHKEATIERIRQHRIVLAPQDTTSLNYNTHPMKEGLGPIGTKRTEAVGLLLHDTMAFSEQGTPLGILDAQAWARDPKDKGKSARRKHLPIEQKESRKWLRSFRKVAEIQKVCPHTKLISIGDRESDIYELFLEATQDPDGPGLLVRMNRSAARKVGRVPLWDYMAKRPVDGTIPLHIPHSGSRQARDTILDVRFAEVELKPPNRLKHHGPIRAWVVYVHEQRKYVADGSPIEWMLMTTVEVRTFEDAQQRVQWYGRRWGIEVYHRTMKSGCRIEDRYLDPSGGLKACIGIDMVVAWRVFHLTMLARETPDAPCTGFFTDEEWQALCIYTSKNPVPPKQPPTTAQASRLVGTMGGYLGRKADGPPGTKSLWRGLQRLEPATEMYIVLTTGRAPP